MVRDTRGAAPVAVVLLVVSAVVVAGVVGAAVGMGGPASDTTTATETATATPTPDPKNVTVIIEHWENKVGIVIQGGADADAITDVRVEGANMTEPMDLSAEYPKGMGTVEDGVETVRVVATFEDGTTRVVAERAV